MPTTLPVGKCRLCLDTAELHDSHMIPRGMYKLVRDGGANHPVLMTKTIQVPTSKQVKAYMFCANCEDRLNKRGESWVLANCWRSDSEFPLREQLVATRPVHTDPGVEGAAFSATRAPGVEIEKLVYFGASVFWRASLTGWPGIFGPPSAPLVLGVYEEQLRLFLLDRAPFPVHGALILYVSAMVDPLPHRLNVSFPRFHSRGEGAHRYRFSALGLTIDLILGRLMADQYRRFCSVRSPERFIFCTPVMDKSNVESAKQVVSRGRPSRSLIAAARNRG